MNILVLGLFLGFYFVLHSILADLKVKAFLLERFIAKKYYRLVYNFISIGLLLPVIWMYTTISKRYLIEIQWVSYLGIGLMFLGFVLLMLSLRQYNLSEFSGLEQWSNEQPPLSSPLRISGLNSIVRHPLYTSSLILLWGWFLYRPSDAVLVIVSITTIYIYFGTKLEEQKLVKEFGTAYLDYQKKVNMLIPFL